MATTATASSHGRCTHQSTAVDAACCSHRDGPGIGNPAAGDGDGDGAVDGTGGGADSEEDPVMSVRPFRTQEGGGRGPLGAVLRARRAGGRGGSVWGLAAYWSSTSRSPMHSRCSLFEATDWNPTRCVPE